MIVYAIVWLFAWLPLPVLYALADVIVFPLAYYVVRYRRKVVRNNLRNSFPEKSTKELRKLERRFYRFFADSIVESIYPMHMTEREMRKRFTFGHVNIIDDYLAKSPGVMMMLAHYVNWEWVSFLQLNFGRPDEQLVGLYRQLKNKRIDRMILDMRQRSGAMCVEKNNVLRSLVARRQDNKPTVWGMIADQKPSLRGRQQWTDFLHQDTAFLMGTEELARKFNYPVVYLDIKRVKRGYYHADVIDITNTPQTLQPGEITLRYANLLEQSIVREPAYWLWSHNRWKNKRQPQI